MAIIIFIEKCHIGDSSAYWKYILWLNSDSKNMTPAYLKIRDSLSDQGMCFLYRFYGSGHVLDPAIVQHNRTIIDMSCYVYVIDLCMQIPTTRLRDVTVNEFRHNSQM